MILLKIDTSLLDKFSPMITLVIVLGMVVIVGRFLFSKSISGAIFSILICGLLLWAINSLNSFMEFLNNFISFIGSIFV